MKKIVIIGGGIAGLTAGIFAQKNGFESIIFEKHHTLGGECTGWNRQGYHIDGCIHWLMGTKEGTPIHDLWTTVGALDGVEIYKPETFLTFEYGSDTVHLYRDLDRLKSSWLELSPEDKDAIEDFYQAVKKLQSFKIPVGKPMDMMNIIEKIKYMGSMKDVGMVMSKYGKITVKEYADKFKHPALREAIASFIPEGSVYSITSILFALGVFTAGQANIPMGGSKELAMRMVDRYLSLGGTIEAQCEVVELNIDNKEVHQLKCRNGKTFEADYFIAACDAKVLYDKLLKGNYPDKEFEKRYNNPGDYPLASNIYVALGYEGTMEGFPRSLRFPVDDFKIHGSPIDYLLINNYQYEANFAPEGHNVITCAINQFYSDVEGWEELAKDSEAYHQEKERIGKEVVRAMEARFSHMKGKIKVLDVATPKTYERYCNAYRGSFMPFIPSIKGKMMNHTGRIKGLKNIFLSGQWLQTGGGLPVALITGKDTIMRICKQEKKTFVGR